MEIELAGVNSKGNHRTGRPVAFNFDTQGLAAVKWRISGDIPTFRHPSSTRAGQPDPRSLDPGTYVIVLQVTVTDLPDLQSTFDSTMTINGVSVARVRGQLPKGQTEDFGMAIFRLVVA